jgi:hypothetical protein
LLVSADDHERAVETLLAFGAEPLIEDVETVDGSETLLRTPDGNTIVIVSPDRRRRLLR